jgi:hypothetical protein
MSQISGAATEEISMHEAEGECEESYKHYFPAAVLRRSLFQFLRLGNVLLFLFTEFSFVFLLPRS